MNLDLDRPVPGEAEAQERAWAAVSAAHSASAPAPSRRRRLGVRVALAGAAVALATVGMAVTPPGEAVADWIVRAVGVQKPRPPVAPALGLPGPGRLLVDTPRGLSLIDRDGDRHDLGDWQDGAFSPRGRFVAAVRANTLAALDLRGEVRWSLRRPFTLSQPAWSPDGLHVVYRSGDGLRVVNGDGSGDRFLDGPAGPAAPVWLDARTVAWADARGGVHTVDALTGRAGWSTPAVRPVRKLLAGSRRVVAITARSARVIRARDGRFMFAHRAPRGEEYVGGATGGFRTALVRHDAEHGLSHIDVMPTALQLLMRDPPESPALPGRVSEPVFSPDGKWLLVGWRVADEWLFLSTPIGAKVAAVPAVGQRLAPISPGRWAFPRVLGWAPAA